MGIIKDDKREYNRDEILELCPQVIHNDINANILVEHQVHIVRNKMIGLVQYYSMQGSYFMNQYLRGQAPYVYRNEYLEMQIKSMWGLIRNAPSFDQEYIVYRFVQTDEFISHLKIGDIYTESGFMSTTRDPFYQNDAYKFGWILIKIKIPKKVVGCALCIETISQFQDEQEIILPPRTQLKLISKNEQHIYHHINKEIGRKIKTRYEFDLINIDRDEMRFDKKPELFGKNNNKKQPIDFLTLERIDAYSMEEKIRKFIMTHVSSLGQFEVKIGDKVFTILSEWYDGSGVYRKYYALNVRRGYSMYTIYNNHMMFIIEIGEQNDVPIMFVNYQVKYTTLDRETIIGGEQFMTFIASVAYYFGVVNVILYADYVSCDYRIDISNEKNIGFLGGTYCTDFYEYLKHNKKKMIDIGINGIELIPAFKYSQLDVLKNISIEDVLKKRDEKGAYDTIYQLYDQTYKANKSNINDNMANFYLFIVENYCFMTDKLIKQFGRISQYVNDNPFENDYYTFNAMSYLYNREKIESIPMALEETMESPVVKTKGVIMNRYRVVSEQRRRVS
jgi:hypothetical protein